MSWLIVDARTAASERRTIREEVRRLRIRLVGEGYLDRLRDLEFRVCELRELLGVDRDLPAEDDGD